MTSPLTRKYQDIKIHLGRLGQAYMMECRDCSTLVSDIERHDEWHQQQDHIAEYIKYLRGDAPFPKDQHIVNTETEKDAQADH